MTETRIGDRQVRHRTKIEDDPSLQDSQQARVRLWTLLESFTSNLDLLSCGYSIPQKIAIYHSGHGWVVESEAVVESDTDSL